MSAKKIATIGIMLALTMVISFFEYTLPPIPMLPPGVRLGLANIVVMHTIFSIGKKEASGIMLAKSAFVFILRGPMAGFLSLCGSGLSIAVVLLAIFLSKNTFSYLILSVFGAIAHNIGQIVAVFFVLKSQFVFYYLPILIVAGVIMGSITGTMLTVIMPSLNRTKKTP